MESVVLDDRAGPYLAYEVVFADQVAGGADQNLKDLESTAAEWNRNILRPQLAPAQVDRPLPRFVDPSAL
jgi:hypothetical protein